MGLLMPAGARAQARSADPEALIRRGNELRQQGRNEEALPLFQAAYAAARTPRTAGQLGLSEMTVGYWVEAEAHLAEALEFPRHPWVARNREGLREMLGKAHAKIAEVVVEGSPRGAEVRVNGRVVGALPMPNSIRIGEGRIEVELGAPSYKTETRSLSVRGGEKQKVTVDLEKVAPAAPAPDSQSAAAPVAEGSGLGSVPSADQTEQAIPSPPHPPAFASVGAERPAERRWGWPAVAAAGTGLLAVGFGTVELVRWQHAEDSFNNHIGPAPGMPSGSPTTYVHDCGEQDPMRGGPGCQSIYDQGVRARLMAILGFAAGGILAVTSAVFWSFDQRDGREQRVSCAFDLGGRGMECQWRF
jgi:hypothetical protein